MLARQCGLLLLTLSCTSSPSTNLHSISTTSVTILDAQSFNLFTTVGQLIQAFFTVLLIFRDNLRDLKMADFGVKLEAEQSPSPKDSPVFVGDDENDTPRSSSPFTFTAHSPGRNHSPSPTPSFADEAPSHAIPTWQRCGNLERSTQVDIKEEAVKNGLTTLKELEAALQHHPEFWSSTKWLERIGKLWFSLFLLVQCVVADNFHSGNTCS